MSVTTHSYSFLHTTYFAEEIILLPYTPHWEAASGLVLYSGDDAVDGKRSCSDAPLSPLLSACGPPVKIIPGSLYDGAALIAPEDGNTRGIWRPPRCGHRWSGCYPFRNRLATEAYPRINYSGRTKLSGEGGNSESVAIFIGQKWPPPGSGLPLRPKGGKIRQSSLTGPVVVGPLLIIIF